MPVDGLHEIIMFKYEKLMRDISESNIHVEKMMKKYLNSMKTKQSCNLEKSK